MRYVGEGQDFLDTKGFSKLMKDYQLVENDDEEKISEEFLKADLDNDGKVQISEFFEYFQCDHYG